MSILRHPTLTAWQRDEQGGYRAEINGWALRVTWRPAHDHHRRGFRWEASRPGGPTLHAEEVYEEIEVAMADAETVATPRLDVRSL
jgi:hypothetical protein